MYTFNNQIYTYEVDNSTLSGSLISIIFDEPLVTNRQYTVSILAGLSGSYNDTNYKLLSDYESWFTSRYCPIFSTIGKVKLQAGPQIDIFLDDAILRMMHKNSLDAVDLYNLEGGYAVPYDYWGCSWHDVPLALRRYVECKTAYDLLSLVRNNIGVPQMKQLGDMTIQYSNTQNKDEPNRLKELYNCWKESIRTFGSPTTATVKGYYDTSKMYGHPVRETAYNRIVRPVIPFQGNFTPGTIGYRGF